MNLFIGILVLILWGSIAAMADIQLNPVFTDHMVLQRGKTTPVFGTAVPGEKVTVKVARQEASAVAGSDGKWMVRLDLDQAGGPFELVAESAGGSTTLTDVMVGEVWMCSGQSNMQFGLKDAAEGPAAIASADLPGLRMIVGRNWTEGAKANTWVVSSTNTAASFPAVGFFFGREIHRALKVPVGLVVNAIGGTPIEAWTRKSSIASDPVLREAVLAAYDRAMAAYPQAKAAYEAAPADRKPPKPVGPEDGQQPGRLFDQHLAPMAGFGMRGVLWYQGESDAWGFPPAHLYSQALPALIRDWRDAFGANLPFIVIQLPDDPHVTSPARPKQVFPWKLVQEAQFKAAQRMTNVGLVVTLDLGEPDIHPKRKEPVGVRSAALARVLAYREALEANGPLYDGFTVEGDKIRIRFNPIGGGLTVMGGGELAGFTLAGEDRHFVSARARIEGDTVVAWHESVPRPAAVRYAFSEGGTFNLWGTNGIPASPFRTDEWPWDTPARESREAHATAMTGPKPVMPDGQPPFTLVHAYRPASNRTEAGFAYDQDHLYVSLLCRQTAPLQPAGEENDDDQILSGDFVEVLLDPQHDRRHYRRFTLNPKGLLLDAACFNDAVDGPVWLRGDQLAGRRGMDKAWSSGATVQVNEQGGGWTAVLAIPWKSLGVEPQKGLTLGLQMERHVAADGENSEWVTAGRDRNTGAMMPWPKLYHSPMRFGALTLE